MWRPPPRPSKAGRSPVPRRHTYSHLANPLGLDAKIGWGLQPGEVMKRTAALILLAAACLSWSLPASAQRENRSVGENGIEAKRAAKQYQKASKKAAKKQQKQMKKYQKAQRKAAKRQKRGH